MKKRTLLDIKKERDQKEKIRKERKKYRDAGVEVPISHWTSYQMLEYFLKVKKKHNMKLIEAKDERSKLAALGAISRLKLNGIQFVEFVNWLEQNKQLKMIWHSIREIKKFKKDRKDLF